MLTLNEGLLIFSDLDGSLLDHHTYQWQPAQRWLVRLQQQRIPVIIATSKTVSEVNALRRVLALEHWPFIAENGAVVGLPDRWHTHPDYPHRRFAPDYGHICRCLNALRLEHAVKFAGFSSLSTAEVAALTGLSHAEAERARQREASEPIQWLDDATALAIFTQHLATQGLSLTQGGRFYHVMGAGVSKGAAAAWLIAQYRLLCPGNVVTIGLGDGPNDISLLQQMDHAVVIRGNTGCWVSLPTTFTGTLYHTMNTGPTGWCEGLDQILHDKNSGGDHHE